MGAGQSTTQKITNEITNRVKLSAENIAAASQRVTSQNINTLQNVTVSGNISVQQYAEVKAVLDAYIQSTQGFQIDQDTINDIAAKASQEVPNLSASINVQDINQEIKNVLTNDIDIQQIVRSTCDLATDTINQNTFQNVMVSGDIDIKQRALADVTAKCLLANKQYAEAMQKISNKVKVASKQTVKDIITGIVALVVVAVMGLAVAKTAGRAVTDKQFIDAASKTPSLWIIWSVPLLLAIGTLAALDCGGKFPLVPKFLTLGIPIPPSICRNKDKKVQVQSCDGVWPFKHSCKPVVDPDTNKPRTRKVPSYAIGAALYAVVLALIAVFVLIQMSSRARAGSVPVPPQDLQEDVVINYTDFL